MENLSETIWVKHVFESEEVLELGQKMARAESVISEKADQLKSVTTAIKAEIAQHEAVLHTCTEKLRSGYEMRPKEVDIQYESGIVKYVDKDTGEIIEERPMTQDEQLRMTGTRIDAEDIIREASENED